MEYDNDRMRKRPPRTEIFFWILLAAVAPMTSCMTAFSGNPGFWFLAFLMAAFTLPFYMIYARIIGNLFLIRKQFVFSALLSLLFFLTIMVFYFTIYTLIAGNRQTHPPLLDYVSLSPRSLVRESVWTIVNMSLSIAIVISRKMQEDRDIVAAVQKDNAFLKLRYLRAQMNPHFLFNTLNSIYSLSLQKSDQAPEVVIRLADIMRYLIYECNEEKIPLDKEIAFIRSYIEIEKTRYRADIRFNIEGNTEDVLIEPFMLISFIENGFKHAIDNTFDEPFIYITLKIVENTLTLNVVNSTSADLETQAKKMTGKGISNSRSLLDMLYPDSYSLDIIQTDKEETRRSNIRMRNARERLEKLYPDSYTLDVILNKNAFTVSLIIRAVMRPVLKPVHA